jgi:hypothetical protein
MGGRIGYGSYERSDREQSKEDLRNRVLDAVGKYAKHVLADLYDEPFKLYLETNLCFKAEEVNQRSKHIWRRPDWKRKFEGRPITYSSHLEAFRQSLFEWSRRNNLNAAWCRECAYETLDYWSYSNPINQRLQFQPLIKMRTLFKTGQDTRRFTLDCKVVHPQLKSLEETEAELRKAFERKLKTYLNDFKSCAKMQGYVPTPEKYKSKYGKEHFRWLVERVVNEKSFQKIITELSIKYKDGLDHSTISKPVIALAKIIELPYPSRKKA